MSDLPQITILTLIPLLGGILLLSLSFRLQGKRGDARQPEKWTRLLALSLSLAALAVAVALWLQFDGTSGDLQFEERYSWIPWLAVDYRVGVDGLGLLMLILSALVIPMAILASWRNADRTPLFFGLLLLLEAGLFGTFTALNFFHWFIYWELSLIPAFFLIKLWGGPNAGTSATRFFIYTMGGSVALLLAFMAIFLATNTFDFLELAEMARDGKLLASLSIRLGGQNSTGEWIGLLVFAGAFLGFAVKVPVMPFHSWLPDTYTEAPSAVTMVLTGLMSKMGVYGFIRILLPIFPDTTRFLTTPLLILAVITIIFSAAAALAQRDLKRMLAYSSINHLGYCMLGLFAMMSAGTTVTAPPVERAAALSGVFLQLFNHGITAATLFWFISLLENRSGGLRGIDQFGGLRQPAPVFCGLMGIALFSSLGLPGLNGFVSEFLIFKGSFPLAPWSAALSLIGLLYTALFILKILQQVFYGPVRAQWAAFPDLTLQERFMLAPSIGLMFLLGMYPQAILKVLNRTVTEMVAALGT